MGWPKDLEEFKKEESRLQIKFICFSPGEYVELLRRNAPDIFEYVQQHYQIKEAGLIEGANRLGYLILEKGKEKKGRDLIEGLSELSGRRETRAIYKVLGQYVFFYTIRPL